MKLFAKTLSMLLVLSMVIGMATVPVLASETDHSFRVLLEQATVGEKAGLKVDMQIKTSSTAIKAAAACVTFDTTVFSLAKPDGTEIELT